MSNGSQRLTQSDFRKLLQTPRLEERQQQQQQQPEGSFSSANLQHSSASDQQHAVARQKALLGGGRHLHRSQAAPTARPTQIPASSSLQQQQEEQHQRSRVFPSSVGGAMAAGSKNHSHQKSQLRRDGDVSAEKAAYRDRAAERRRLQGRQPSSSSFSSSLAAERDVVGDVPRDSRVGASVLLSSSSSRGAETPSSAAVAVAGMSEEQRMEYEKSKYLGGSVESTHLVKGLDFLLLRKIRADQGGGGAENLDSELERLVDHHHRQGQPGSLGDDDDEEAVECTSGLGKRVLLAAIKRRGAESKNRRGPVVANELFLPARMYYQFRLDAPENRGVSSALAMTMRIRSQGEVARLVADGAVAAMRGLYDVDDRASDRVVIAKVVSAIRAAREKRDNKEAASVSAGKAASSEAAAVVAEAPKSPTGSADAASFDSDDDIFADAGVDYEVTVEKAQEADVEEHLVGPAPLPPDSNSDSDSDDGDGSDKHDKDVDSDEEFAVVAPYPAAMSVDSSDDEQVTAPYPESPKSREAKRPRIDDNDNNSDRDDDNLDMRLFAEARLRFKEETRDLLYETQRSAAKNPAKKEKASSGSLNKEWQQTRKIMKEKYGVDIADDSVKKTRTKKDMQKANKK